MLRALYDYGMAHPEIIPPAGYVSRTLHYIVELDAVGNFLGIRKSEDSRVLCPDVTGATRGSGQVSNVLMEKACIALCLDTGDDGKKLERLNGKRQCFKSYFEDGQIQVPEFSVVLRALDTEDMFESIQTEAVHQKIKVSDVIGFSVNGKLLSELPSVRLWWADRSQVVGKTCTALDVVTGKPCVPARLFKPVSKQDAGGGQSSGVALISFNEASFESYGKVQGSNVPMSQETADIIMAAFANLSRNGVRVGGMTFFHWYDCEIADSDDILLTSLFDVSDISDDGNSQVDEDVMNQMASNLVMSPLAGVNPVGLSGHRYHILLTRPDNARFTVFDYTTGSYDELYVNLCAWFDDLTIVSLDGKRMLFPRKFSSMLYMLLSKSEKSKTGPSADKFKPLSSFIGIILNACVYNRPLPDIVAIRALNAIQSDIYANGRISVAVMQWLKLWLCRKIRLEGGCLDMSDLNLACDNMAYQCGRLLAVYERIQTFVSPDMNVGVLEKYYASCSQNPEIVLGSLQVRSVHYLKKFTSRAYKDLFAQNLRVYGPVFLAVFRKI